MAIKVIVTGATGMVGEGVLHECLLHPEVSEVLVIGRKSCGVTHSKLKEIIHKDFFDLSAIENQLSGYNSCLFCLGVSSVGMNEEQYHRLTYELTMNFAGAVLTSNPGMDFCYISGAGTDSTEKGKSMWARVKGKTENHLLSMVFGNAYMFRPGYMQPTKGLKNTLKWYKFFSWMYPVLKLMFRKYVSTLKELGLAMIHTSAYGHDSNILEVSDIIKSASNSTKTN